ncbi:MAG: carbohydrate-binding protein [Candidatus Korobacteraceae bacterium]
MVGSAARLYIRWRRKPHGNHWNTATLTFMLVAFSALTGCGGGASPTPSSLGSSPQPSPTSVAVSIAPVSVGTVGVSSATAQVSVPANHTITLSASVSGTTNTAVTWSAAGIINGNPAVGTIAGTGLTVTYQAPAVVPQAASVIVTATSVADISKSASLSVAITPPPAEPAVAVVTTTDDQSERLKQQADLSFSNVSAGSQTIVVDENQRYQSIEGFGAAFTDSAAYLLNEVATPDSRAQAMSDLFTREGNGIGLSFMRNPIGASDMARSMYSFDDMPAGQSDPDLTNFSTAHDQADILPIIKQARQLNPQLRIVASPWSPPGWMKTNGSMIGGSLIPSAYNAFAQYFVKYIQAYAVSGVAIDYITLQNEPVGTPPNYPGMLMDAPTQTIVLRDYVLPALDASNLDTKVLLYDHDWTWADYPASVLADPVILKSNRVAGIAWHGYSGTPGVENDFLNTGNYETEHSGGIWIADQVKNDFEEITQVMRNGGRTYVKWNLALDENRGPHTGGGSTCTPLVTVNSQTGKVSYPIDYFTLGHFSRYVLPNAARIYSSNVRGLVSVAFANTDNSKTLIVFNDTSSAHSFQVQWGTLSFSYSLPALGGATFSWTGTQIAGYTLDAHSQIQASSFNSASGLRSEVTSDVDGGYDLGFILDGAFAAYQNVDFGNGVSQVSVSVANPTIGGTIEFHIDSVGGPVVASVPIPATGDWQSWTTAVGTAASVIGIHDLILVFRGTGDIGNVNWFRFS